MLCFCSWCNKALGEKAPLSDRSITHGMCENCRRKVEGEAAAYWQKKGEERREDSLRQ